MSEWWHPQLLLLSIPWKRCELCSSIPHDLGAFTMSSGILGENKHRSGPLGTWYNQSYCLFASSRCSVKELRLCLKFSRLFTLTSFVLGRKLERYSSIWGKKLYELEKFCMVINAFPLLLWSKAMWMDRMLLFYNFVSQCLRKLISKHLYSIFNGCSKGQQMWSCHKECPRYSLQQIVRKSTWLIKQDCSSLHAVRTPVSILKFCSTANTWEILFFLTWVGTKMGCSISGLIQQRAF